MSTQMLRETLETILAADDQFPARFYEILFERHPELRALFKSSSPNVQRLKFAQTLAWVVDHNDDHAEVQRALTKLAIAHRGFGVTDEMYPMVTDALLDTLREGL